MPGAFILAANHASVFDSALAGVTVSRTIYWLSIVEIFRHPLARWFLSGMGAMPLDRSGNDVDTLRVLARHLKAGRVVGIFPEGQLRLGQDSVLRGGHIRDGICRIAQMAGVPIVPCVIQGGEQFTDWRNWLPLARTRYGVAFGEPIWVKADMEKGPARRQMVTRLEQALRALNAELVMQSCNAEL